MHFEELLFAAVLILGIVAVSVAIFKRLAMGAILGFLAELAESARSGPASSR